MGMLPRSICSTQLRRMSTYEDFIVQRSAGIVTFLGLLTLNLHAPQLRHLERLADLLVVAPRRKTLAELAAQEFEGIDPSNLADFFRISPWDSDALRLPLVVFILQYLRCPQGRLPPAALPHRRRFPRHQGQGHPAHRGG